MKNRFIDGQTWVDKIEIGVIDASEVDDCLDVAARGMRDNPLHVAAFGKDPERRRLRFRALMAAVFSAGDISHTLVARDEKGVIVGICGMMPPGCCKPSTGQQLRILASLMTLGLRTGSRVMSWMGVWQKQDYKERHWHLGPLAVDAHVQGEGVGSRMMGVFCAQMDAAREDVYLETDKEINVRFYERFGFEVVAKREVLGVPNWFMVRSFGRREV